MNKKYHKVMLNTASIFADLSYAKRLKVGATLAKNDRIVACGYNGTLSKNSNICEINNTTLDSVIHAEQNIISFCAKNGISTKNTTLYITHAPCINCAKLIVSSGIKSVYYINKYRSKDGIKLLKQNKIKCKQIKHIKL